MIEITNLTKTYAKSAVQAVESISLTAKNGEILGFLGPNGAGKSTTIKCLCGILPFESGSISICGIDIKENPVEAKKKIAYVADENILYAGLTGTQYINFVCDLYGVSAEDRKARVEKYAAMFDMTDKLGQKISSYSHGMKQKISIISGLCHNPDVWVLDEPMTGLDPRASFALKNLMREFADAGKTVFFSSHVLEVVEKVCDRVAIIDKGKLISLCDMSDLQAHKNNVDLEKLFLQLTDAMGGQA